VSLCELTPSTQKSPKERTVDRQSSGVFMKRRSFKGSEGLQGFQLTEMSILQDDEALQRAFEKPSLVATLQQLSKIIAKAKLDLKDFSDGLEYSGFDRERVGKMCAERFGAKGTAKLLLLGVKRGTRIDKILKSSVKVDQELKAWFDSGKIKSGGKGPDVVTIGRMLACFPDCAVLIGQLFPIKPKLPTLKCPVELQFPAAASLPMSPGVRILHIEFCKEFGTLIKSPFDPKFYEIAFNAMIPVNQVDQRVLGVLGNPSDSVSRAFDIQSALQNGGVKIPKQSDVKFPVESHSQTGQEDLEELFR